MSNPEGVCSYLSPKSGKAQLSTELTISADEFDVYDVYATPTTISFHLREFNVCHDSPLSMSTSYL
jgi:cell cycle checkpoint control protein RAD9A